MPDAVEAACREHQAKTLYSTPTIHNPTATTMPLERRHAIVEVARRNGLRILEDDAYGLLPSDPITALASLAPEITIHVATVSKVLSPALRVAYLVAPDAPAARAVSAALRANVLMASPLMTGLMTAWIEGGTAGAVISAIRRECAARQRIVREILPEGSFNAHPGGLHLWLRLPRRWDRLDFAAHLQRRDGLAPCRATPSGSAATSRRTRYESRLVRLQAVTHSEAPCVRLPRRCGTRRRRASRRWSSSGAHPRIPVKGHGAALVNVELFAGGSAHVASRPLATAESDPKTTFVPATSMSGVVGPAPGGPRQLPAAAPVPGRPATRASAITMAGPPTFNGGAKQSRPAWRK